MEGKSIIGIDEAGLGPVFGPLVVAGTVIDEKKQNFLKKNGVKDSKLFSKHDGARELRREVWEKNKTKIKKHHYTVISATEIDRNFMNGITMYNLEIEGIKTILNKLYVDSVKEIIIHQIGGLSKKKFLEQLEIMDERMSFLFPLIKYEKSADLKYIPVSMASIIAKSVRDEIVEKLCHDIGIDYVSGYPTPTTARFLENYYRKYGELPHEVRITRKWEPLQSIIHEMKG